MKQFVVNLYYKYRNLILYGIIGCFTASLDFITYTLLTQAFGMHHITANCISVPVGIITSFLLNRAYNFKVKDHPVQRFSIFLAVGLCGMLLSNLILFIGIDRMECNKIMVKLVSIVLVVFIQFLLNKFITFRQVKK